MLAVRIPVLSTFRAPVFRKSVLAETTDFNLDIAPATDERRLCSLDHVVAKLRSQDVAIEFSDIRSVRSGCHIFVHSSHPVIS